MEEAGGRECEGRRVEDRGSCRSNEMEGRSESNRGEDEVYPATFANEEETGLKLDDDDDDFAVPKDFFPSLTVLYFLSINLHAKSSEEQKKVITSADV